MLLQQLLRAQGLEAVAKPRDGALGPREVNLIVLPPAEMVSALASKAIAGFIVAEPFNALAEQLGVGKILRFSGDVWQNHACCVTFLAERDLNDKPEWSQRVTTALVKAQLWTRNNQLDTARLLSAESTQRYTPHNLRVLSKVLAATDYSSYEANGVVHHKNWAQRRIDFQPYPFPSYTQELVRALRQTRVEGEAGFLAKLDPAFAARDLVDDRFVRKALTAVGGPGVFGLPASLTRSEVVAV